MQCVLRRQRNAFQYFQTPSASAPPSTDAECRQPAPLGKPQQSAQECEDQQHHADLFSQLHFPRRCRSSAAFFWTRTETVSSMTITSASANLTLLAKRGKGAPAG